MDDSDDDYGYYGSLLEQLDADDYRSAKAPRIEDQVVTDKQGRRRFHGAFTGGFSAGFFNSVGTKEGWTPSTFVSSRSQRAGSKLAKPQDFMDDEDLEAHGISPHGIQATSSFDDSESRKRKRVIDPSGPIPGVPVLEEILKPTKETMGMKLLRKLGWKPGQGIGPRIKPSQKKSDQKETKRIYGCQMPPDTRSESDNEGDDEEAFDSNVTFAPDDVESLYLSHPKSDQFGLGYKPLDRTPVLGGHINLFDPSPLSMTAKKKKVLIKGQAFGVGAFEEEDEDIYATEDMSNYDFGEEKSPEKTKQQRAKSHMDLMGLVNVLEGFSLSSQRHHDPKIYPKPTLPKGFVPQHKSRRRRFELKDSEKQGLGRHELTAEQRARIIADQPLATVEIRSGVKAKPVDQFDNSSQKHIDTSEIDQIYEEFKSAGGNLKSDFKPFAKDIEKQRRYDLYLRMRDRGQKDRYYLAQPKSMTEWEREREIHEFERAAALFRPLSSNMATRFVSAVVEDKGPVLKDGLNVDIPKASQESKTSEIDALGHDVADDRVKAARMNMFGQLTQTLVDWYPDRLLCKRFNVPDPYPDTSFVGVRNTKRERFSIFKLLDAPPESAMDRREKTPPKFISSMVEIEGPEDVQNPETYGLKVPVDGPPTMDLFKAIFQDSDSESEDENEEETKEENSDKEIERTTDDENSIPRFTPSGEKTILESESDENLRSSVSIRDSLESFISGMRRGDSDSSKPRDSTQSPYQRDDIPSPKPETSEVQQKKRISRFEPQKDAHGTLSTEMPKPVFMPRKKASQPSQEEPLPAKGVFANIDFDFLNSYRNFNPTDALNDKKDLSNSTQIHADSKDVPQNASSDSSVDSEDEYGPAMPSHLKNRLQMIRAPSASVTQPKVIQKQSSSSEDTRWVEKEGRKKHPKKPKKTKKEKRKEKKKKKKSKKYKER